MKLYISQVKQSQNIKKNNITAKKIKINEVNTLWSFTKTNRRIKNRTQLDSACSFLKL